MHSKDSGSCAAKLSVRRPKAWQSRDLQRSQDYQISRKPRIRYEISIDTAQDVLPFSVICKTLLVEDGCSHLLELFLQALGCIVKVCIIGISQTKHSNFSMLEIIRLLCSSQETPEFQRMIWWIAVTGI